MKTKIILPNNTFGLVIMLILLVLVLLVPFTLTLWLVLKFAPWWVAVPLALSASLIAWAKCVKRQSNSQI